MKPLTEMEFSYCVVGATFGEHPANPETGYQGTRGGFIVQYGADGFGFGEITFVIRLDGTLECASELCSPSFVKRLMTEVVKRAWFTELKSGDRGFVPVTPEINDKNQHGNRGDESELEPLKDEDYKVIMAPDTIKKVEANNENSD